jgi:hypothetical protein
MVVEDWYESTENHGASRIILIEQSIPLSLLIANDASTLCGGDRRSNYPNLLREHITYCVP